MKLSSCFVFFFFYLLTLTGILCVTSPVFAGSEKLTLTADDGYEISALLTVPDRELPAAAGVVLVHMYRHTKESWAPLVDVLIGRGITCLAIDLRGHGESLIAPDGSDSNSRVMNRDPEFFNVMYRDAAAALKYMNEKRGIPPERTALVAASVGSSIAIRAAIDHPVAGVVVMTPGENYLGIPTMEHIKQWPGIPLLILTSEEEADRGAAGINDALKNRGAHLMVFDKERIHGTNMFGQLAGVEKIIADWLAELFQLK